MDRSVRMTGTRHLCLPALLLALASGAAAQQLRPVGDFTFFARDGVSEIMGLLVFASDPGAPAARISIPGQQSLVFQSMRLDGRTVTLSERAGDAVIELVLVFDTDSTFSGTWRMGDQQGPVSGRRGVLPGAVEPSCREYAVDPPPSAAREPTSDPDSARIFTRDVHLFWEVLDGSTPDDLIERLHCGYLRGGSDAVRDFIPGRILSAARLAEMIQSRRDRYDEVRAATLALDTMEQVIRDVFHSMKRLLPEAVFPDVHFVIGRLNTGGTTSARGLLIGAEMYRSHEGIPQIIAHELAHYQQKSILPGQRTLLAQSIMEGSADFVAELVTGRHINSRAHEYALPRERELWEEFSQVMHGTDWTGWLYGGAPEGRPTDLGYFFGYRIAQSYYERATDRARALRDILRIEDYAEFFRRSGYAPR